MANMAKGKQPAEPNQSVLMAINRVLLERNTCETEEELGRFCLATAEELTGSRFGFIGELNASGLFDTIAISNPGWDACKVPGSDALQLIKNMEIRGVDRGCMTDGAARIVNDVAAHPESIGTPEGHPPVKRLLAVPFFKGKRVSGMIAVANKAKDYTAADKEAVEALSVAMVEAMDSKRAELSIARQSQEIMDLSTPVIQVWEGVVVAPLIGVLDSGRTQIFMNRFLNRIAATGSSIALLDITGVPAMDTQTAQHLTETIAAARLLGTEVILTGVRPAIAQTMVHLGIDLPNIQTRSDLAAGLNLALKKLGLKIVKDA